MGGNDFPLNQIGPTLYLMELANPGKPNLANHLSLA